jgi:mevalonate kinase
MDARCKDARCTDARQCVSTIDARCKDAQLCVSTYPSKILLLGEYGILLGSQGLAVPYPAFGGSFAYPGQQDDVVDAGTAHDSNQNLRSLLEHLESRPEDFHFLDLIKLRQDIESGLWFNSNIPQGYGVGSSGALTAAIFENYEVQGTTAQTLPEVRLKLASIEKYFHGTSSGLDPLVALINAPILIEKEGNVRSLEASALRLSEDSGLFLIDTKSIGKTGKLVPWFLEKYQDWEFRRAVDEVYLPAVQQAVDSLLQSNYADFRSEFATISAFQMQFLAPMIPSHFLDFVDDGLSTDTFYLKLCGSGGGGFMLGTTQHPEKAKSYFQQKGFDIRFLF